MDCFVALLLAMTKEGWFNADGGAPLPKRATPV